MTDTFKAATFNVFYGTDLDAVERVLRKMLRDGVTIFLLQEASAKGFTAMLDRLGLAYSFHKPQYVVAWVPSAWVGIDKGGVRLSQTAYYRKGGNNEIHTEAAWAILSDKEGRTLRALSYHTPAHVQVAPENRPPRRFAALVEAMGTLKALAETTQTRAVLFGGDDNVDEAKAFAPTWKFMLRAATGLRQVVAPEGTHGKGPRRIDDFRVKGLVPVGEGYVIENPSDHDAFVQTFRWR